MERARGAAAIGGVYAGALLGAIAGTVEAVMFLESANLRDSLGSSVLFFLLSISSTSSLRSKQKSVSLTTSRVPLVLHGSVQASAAEGW